MPVAGCVHVGGGCSLFLCSLFPGSLLCVGTGVGCVEVPIVYKKTKVRGGESFIVQRAADPHLPLRFTPWSQLCGHLTFEGA